jgi:hypothetical protein
MTVADGVHPATFRRFQTMLLRQLPLRECRRMELAGFSLHVSDMVKNRPEHVRKLFKNNTFWSANREPLHQHASLNRFDWVQASGPM